MESDKLVSGFVFNIQHYSIHDGPGIRTTVFLNGCPLRCLWCQNPESQPFIPQIFFTNEKCTGCGNCIAACPEKAITIVRGKSKTDRILCNGCGKCTEMCPNEARNLMGKKMSAGDVFKDVNADSIFYQRSGGGITITGGEPLAQPDFTFALLRLCKENLIHTALETCGFANWEIFAKILKFTDLVLYDFKHMVNEDHKTFTGVSNKLILENARNIIKEFPGVTFVARIPLVPGYNNSKENLYMTAEFIKGLGTPIKVHILPYNILGEGKYERLEKPKKTVMVEPPSEEYMEEIKNILESYGLISVIGG